jgi:hypothetical protein
VSSNVFFGASSVSHSVPTRALLPLVQGEAESQRVPIRCRLRRSRQMQVADTPVPSYWREADHHTHCSYPVINTVESERIAVHGTPRYPSDRFESTYGFTPLYLPRSTFSCSLNLPSNPASNSPKATAKLRSRLFDLAISRKYSMTAGSPFSSIKKSVAMNACP